MTKTPVYNKNRFPARVEKGRCRGCRGEVPKGRRTWCSNACNDRFNPQRVIFAVRQRDGWICQICGGDIREMLAKWESERPPSFYSLYPFPHANPVFDGRNFQKSPEYAAANEAESLHHARRPRREYDHIIPFCDGGLTVLENIRTLCSPCHKQRTRQFAIERAMRIAAEKEASKGTLHHILNTTPAIES